ncbi:flagellar motor switch protein FliM [Sporolactobacillus shoreicorticis]|uniref:Flagellar motor switch protein FliM n=1 Tax=Sporolactobacillus shoreicorticis TaxID=1923877 RepID=A0ABW5S8E8_9BACL|nr:flagellar motor switch protein FliM [Sporolactobacillus shoreicorticis]MCO7125988.1 flagellar motor switch protein FliM [Sporolactobacillus shoreicorticis]
MADILSQSEIDALLSALSTGEMNAEELKDEEKKSKVRVYDFKRALRFSKDQIRSLTRIHENYARLLTSFFSAQLRTYVQISVASVDQLPYEEFIRSIPSATVLNIIEAPPLEGHLIIEVNPNIAYAMLDRLLGGSGESMNKIENLTEIETDLMKGLFEGSLPALKEAWTSVEHDINPFLVELETNPQFLQLVSPNETVIVISLSAMIGKSSGMINLCLPHVVLEPIIPKLSMHYWMNEKKNDATTDEYRAMKKSVEHSYVNVTAKLGQSQITVNELLHLSIGDVIKLDQHLEQPIVIEVGSLPKFTAQAGKREKRIAVQIIKKLTEEDDVDE